MPETDKEESIISPPVIDNKPKRARRKQSSIKALLNELLSRDLNQLNQENSELAEAVSLLEAAVVNIKFKIKLNELHSYIESNKSYLENIPITSQFNPGILTNITPKSASQPIITSQPTHIVDSKFNSNLDTSFYNQDGLAVIPGENGDLLTGTPIIS